ncbi:MAG TPA: metal ABC transporter permease [Myxococcaceae bacterium]|nr:metal ABC transporter permease [Myxococcaceae bacterium]
MSFWDARFLWEEPMLAAVLASAMLGYLGLFVVLRRIGFMSAALSQVSGLGVALAFLAGSFAGVTPHTETPPWLHPSLWALAFASLGAAAMAVLGRSRRGTPETVVAVAYVGASSLVLLVLASPRLVQEAHEIGDLLFGNAVVVRRQDLWNLGLAALLVSAVHGLLFRSFLFASFDSDAARVAGVPVQRVDLLLHLSLALEVAVATRALGTLPVFSFLVLPAGAALLLAERLTLVLLLSVVIAVSCAVGGYVLSWFLSLPTGPVMVVLGVAVWSLAGLRRLVRTRFR